MTKMNRRSFVKGAAIGAVAAPLATPALAQERIEMAIVATWGRDFPGLGTGAQRYAETIQKFQADASRLAIMLPESALVHLTALMKWPQVMHKAITLQIITGKAVTQVMGTSQRFLLD